MGWAKILMNAYFCIIFIVVDCFVVHNILLHLMMECRFCLPFLGDRHHNNMKHERYMSIGDIRHEH